MDNTGNSFGLPQLIIAILFVIGYAFFHVRYSDAPVVKRNFKRFLILRNLENRYRPFLSKYFIFYNALNQSQRIIFERRVQKFIDMKQFIPRGGIKEVTAEMKAMIAGCAIQMTFGYPEVYFRHFWRILIYPNNYYSAITRKYHKGEVNIGGIIVLSWKGFSEGFMDPVDGRNLGFHEMAHALRLINIVDNDEYDFYDRTIMNEFEAEAQLETVKILNSPEGTSLFRNYCVTNPDEFFSVAVECFFERPADFRNYNPKLYGLLSLILKSDPFALYSGSKSEKIAS